jgi:hypothetical protein
MKRRILAALVTLALLTVVLHWSSGQNPKAQPVAVKLPRAIGAIHPRLSSDGETIAFSYQGEPILPTSLASKLEMTVRIATSRSFPPTANSNNNSRSRRAFTTFAGDTTIAA